MDFYGVGVGSMQEEKFDKEAKGDGGSMMLKWAYFNFIITK